MSNSAALMSMHLSCQAPPGLTTALHCRIGRGGNAKVVCRTFTACPGGVGGETGALAICYIAHSVLADRAIDVAHTWIACRETEKSGLHKHCKAQKPQLTRTGQRNNEHMKE